MRGSDGVRAVISQRPGCGDASRTTFEGVTPKHLFKVWGTYQLPGALQDWTLGAGATSQSRTSKSGDAATYNPDSLDILLENLRARRAGSQLPNQVELGRGY